MFGQSLAADPSKCHTVGFTFSKRQADALGIPWRETFAAAASITPDLVRLGAYWDELEPRSGEFDFSLLDWLLDQAAARGLPVLLTVGMKAPRWPEFYLPGWVIPRWMDSKRLCISDDLSLREHTLAFLTRVVERYRGYDLVAAWQVENEPLDPAGPQHWYIGAEFLRQEVELVRALDQHSRPIIVNMFVHAHPLGMLPPWRGQMAQRASAILEIADVLGLDLYPSVVVPLLGRNLTVDWSPWPWEQPAITLRRLAAERGKSAWIIEAQAEPWDPFGWARTDPQPNWGLQPTRAARNAARLQAAGFDHLLFWGIEHWYMRLWRHHDASWWNALQPFLSHKAGARVHPLLGGNT